ncbi:hypothetical protein WSM22_27760 [Cytophagales bacterium WSM2-2]|nr:hypothetical protein WSM22_27760 [Cytophagales bacterium WSM2-2]
MRNLIVIVLAFVAFPSFAQSDSTKAVEEIKSFQKELNEEYKDRTKSPLTTKDFSTFKEHDFFPIDLKYRVTAKLNLAPGSSFSPMATTGKKIRTYRVFGTVEFSIDGKTFKVPVYQSKELMLQPEYADYLFFPFTDLTNGSESYEAGRYIGLRIPKDDELIIDFNQAYNPYCAYADGYSCPIVPTANNLNVAVRAGVRFQKKH